jgi:hypothetical protein
MPLSTRRSLSTRQPLNGIANALCLFRLDSAGRSDFWMGRNGTWDAQANTQENFLKENSGTVKVAICNRLRRITSRAFRELPDE